MGKEKSPPKFGTNQAGATAKFVRVPPRKARLVIDAVRGKYVSDALAILKFVPNFAAEAISDVIKSAVANAENGRPYDEGSDRPLPPLNTDNLKLVRAFIDEGPRIKRVQPRAQGRAYRIVKRMCHITVIVEEVEPKPRPQRRPQTGRRARTQAAPARPAVVAKPAEEARPEAPAPAEETTPVVAAAPAEQPRRDTPDVAPAEEGMAANAGVPTPAPAADSADDAPAEKTPDAE